MKRFTRELGQVMRLEGWSILVFELFYRMVTVPAYVWILNKSLGITLKLAGYSFLTAENIEFYLLKPWTMVCLLALGIVAAIFMAVETGSLISAFQAAAYYRKVSALEMFVGGIKKTADEIKRKNWKLFALILAQTLLGNIPFLYRFLIRIRPVNFVLEEFFSTKAGWIFFLSAAAVAAAWILPGIFTVYGCMIEQKNFQDSYRRSKYIMEGKWRETFLPLIGYSVAAIAGFAAAYAVFVLCVSWAAVEFHYTGLTKIMILSLRDKAEMFWLLLAEGAAAVVYCGAATVEYYHYTSERIRKKQWDFEYPAEPFFERKKVAAAIVGIGLVNLVFVYDAFCNGLGAANAIMMEIPVTAHRGSSREAPENTMAALEKAVDSMAEYAEIDVQMTKDGVIVLSHDTTLKRTAGVNRRIQDMTYEELAALDAGSWFSEEFQGEKIPDLRTVMDYAKGRILLNIEIKNEGAGSLIPEETVALIEEYDMIDQCVVTSVSMNYLKRVKMEAPDIVTGYIVSAAYGDYYSDEAVDFISIRSSLVDGRLVERLHEMGKAVHVWTVNSKNESERMKLLSVDNIITDAPVMVKEVIYGEIEEGSILEYMKLLLK